MRVLLVGTGVQAIPPAGYGGVERTLAEFAQALATAGHEPVVLNRVGRGRSIDEYRFALDLIPRLRRERFDILHASTPVVANRLAWARQSFVYTTHSRHWFECQGARQRWGLYLERRAVRSASRVVALTAALARTIGARVPESEGRTRVIPIGVDLQRFKPDWSRRIGQNVLGVGVVRPFKRWELAAQALKGTGLTLKIAGPLPDPAYAARVRMSGDRVEMLGEVDESTLERLYAESDILLHPSRVELLPGVVLQALAAGMPVLGASPIAELVEEGQTGRTTTAQDETRLVAFLRQAAVELAQDAGKRRAWGEAARRLAETRYAWPRVVEAHLALYRSMDQAAAL